MPHNLYRGLRLNGLSLVQKNGAPFDPQRSLALRNHSPAGFEWGYGGSGPSQLALAILVEELDDDELALELYQDFKLNVIANLAPAGWSLTSADVEEWLGGIRVRLSVQE
jgi:hypothetical protein